jgi:hypothetical protein
VIGLIPINKSLEFRVQEGRPEFVLFHFPEGLIRGPAVLRHPVYGRHHTGAMSSSNAVHKYRLMCSIIHQ